MKEELKTPQTDADRTTGLAERSADSALTPLGTPPAPPVRSRAGDMIHTSPEFAVGRATCGAEMGGEVVVGTSLWKDAWRRLLKKTRGRRHGDCCIYHSCFSLAGPPIIRNTTATLRLHSARLRAHQSFAPFTAPEGSFSWAQPDGH